MNPTSKAFLWLTAGPAVSFFAGYACFLVFGFILGAGFDLDDTGSPSERFFGRLALPSLGLVFLGGCVTSVVMAGRNFARSRSRPE